MSTPTANTQSFNFGFHRAVIRALATTAPGRSARCPICHGKTKGGTVTAEGDPDGSLVGAIHCADRKCFSIVQRIERGPKFPTFTKQEFDDFVQKFMA